MRCLSALPYPVQPGCGFPHYADILNRFLREGVAPLRVSPAPSSLKPSTTGDSFVLVHPGKELFDSPTTPWINSRRIDEYLARAQETIGLHHQNVVDDFNLLNPAEKKWFVKTSVEMRARLDELNLLFNSMGGEPVLNRGMSINAHRAAIKALKSHKAGRSLVVFEPALPDEQSVDKQKQWFFKASDTRFKATNIVIHPDFEEIVTKIYQLLILYSELSIKGHGLTSSFTDRCYAMAWALKDGNFEEFYRLDGEVPEGSLSFSFFPHPESAPTGSFIEAMKAPWNFQVKITKPF